MCGDRVPGGCGGAGGLRGTRVSSSPEPHGRGSLGTARCWSWGLVREDAAVRLAAGCVLAEVPRLVPDEKGLICIRKLLISYCCEQ